MSKKINIISNVLTFCITIALCVLAVVVTNGRYVVDMPKVVLNFTLGAIIAGLICTALHELGHVIFGKSNGFDLISICIWFFKWHKRGKKFEFDFVMIKDCAGYTEMLPKHNDNLDKRFNRMTMGGSVFVFVAMLIGLIPIFVNISSFTLYSVLLMFLPIGAYVFFGNILPMSTGGVRNDGAILSGIKNGEDSVKVALNILAIQGEMYNGKTPAEIDKKLYFDIPQLPEDDYNFAMILNARYLYYLDAGEVENALSVSERLLSLEDYFSKEAMFDFKRDALYNACVLKLDEEVADDLMYELEKTLNKDNSVANIRAKMAYLIVISKEVDSLGVFYKKGVKEAKKHPLKGYGLFEIKLLDKLVNFEK